jgi:hypothetical protein
LQRRFVKWCRDNQITLWRVPFERIQWRRLASAAIRREPPFSAFDPKGKSEKGFRDALILETLAEVHASRPPKRIVFICADGRLSEAAIKLLGADRLSIYKTSAEFLSYLKLQRKNFVDETIKALLDEAAAVFYSPNSATCVYTKSNIPKQLHACLPAEFAKRPTSNVLLAFGEPETFTAVTGEGYQIGATNIEMLPADIGITFKTEVTVAQSFRSSHLYLSSLEQLRTITALVFWSAEPSLSPQLELSNPAFESVKLEETRFETSTDERLISFNLPTQLERLIATQQPTPTQVESS